MADFDTAPPVSKRLVEWLEQTFPDRCPDPSVTDREVWISVGKAHVVRYLRNLHTHQTSPEE